MLSRIYLVYIKQKNPGIPFNDTNDFLRNLKDKYTTLVYHTGVEVEQIQQFEKHHYIIQSDNANLDLRIILKNIIVYESPYSGNFEYELPSDIIDCDYCFNNLYLVSTNKQTLNNIAYEIKKEYKRRHINRQTIPDFYSITLNNINKARITKEKNNAKE